MAAAHSPGDGRPALLPAHQLSPGLVACRRERRFAFDTLSLRLHVTSHSPRGRDDCTVRVMVRCVPAARQATSLGRGALTGEAVVPRASRGDRIRGGSGAGGIGGRGGEGLRRC